MDGLIGFVLMLLGWAAFAFQEASKRRKRNEARERLDDGAPPPASGSHGERRSGAADQLAVTLPILQSARELARDDAPRALVDAIEQALQEARSLAGLERTLGTSLAAEGEAVHRVQRLEPRARALRELAVQHADSAGAPLLSALSAALFETVPELPRGTLLARTTPELQATAGFLPTELRLLPVDSHLERRPWEAASLVEQAWAEVLLGREDELGHAMATAAEVSSDETPMDRFAGSLATAWAPALLLDAAAAASIGGGHGARVRELVERSPGETRFVVRLDRERRVDSVPPPGLRLLVLGALLHRLGIPDAAGLTGPRPPGGVLHLRGPGIWDQVAIAPVVQAAARVQARFLVELASRPGLEDVAEMDAAARRLVEGAAKGDEPSRAAPRALLAALGRIGLRNDRPLLGALLLSGLGASRRDRRAEPSPASSGPATREFPSPARASNRMRQRAAGQAVLLGEALAGRRS